ncbi:Mitochondrial presequence protease [Podosphaera aphanis]|nr:Mitochondrial presequence protease [Podosphaera aphanis]
MLRKASRKLVSKKLTDLSLYPKPGEKIHGFTLLRAKAVPELGLAALHFQHDKTGAECIHIARDDKNNVFSIGFKTNPPDDTGVPHILEHTTLYPIRDPFFKMLPRTLSNFMNAMTASDHTYYPFATTNAQDYKNLMSVYLDATLHPLLRKTDFIQEGWRIGPENPNPNEGENSVPAEDNNLVFKGVVYNEMKGQMSDSGYLYYIRFQDHIFPDINNSGGDPQKITDLTYEQLRKFHASHYHPSNSKVFTYGDMPYIDHLKEINSYFSDFDKIKPDVEVKIPIDLSSGPQNISVAGPVDPLMPSDLQHKTSTSWIMGDTTNVLETFSLGIMSALLMDGYGSPLYQNLIEAGLGTEWSPNSGFDASGRISIFSIGLTGVKEENVSKVKDTIHNTFRAVYKKGFERFKVRGYLHQMEIGLKHKTAKFGMSLMNRIQPQWFEGTDPFDSLAWNEIISEFETNFRKGGYLEGLMAKYLLNDNTLTFTMTPSLTYNEDLAHEEAQRLAKKIHEASQVAGGEVNARVQLQKDETELLKEQEKTKTENLNCLPTVYVKDIPRKKEIVEVLDSKVGNVAVQWRRAPTNGLTYFRAINVIENLPSELRKLMPLFTDSIMRLGTKDMTVEQIEDLIKLKTGGLSITYYNSRSPLDLRSSSEGLAFSGTALDRNVSDMLKLLRELVVQTNFDSPEAESQIRQLLQASSDGAVNSIASQGHSFAISAAENGFGEYFSRKEQVSGLSQLKLISKLSTRPKDEGLSDVIHQLKKIQKIAFSGSSFRCAVTCGVESFQSNEKEVQKFISSLSRDSQLFKKNFSGKKNRNAKLFYPLPYQVYYGGLSIPTTPYNSSASAPLQILSSLLTHKYLHHEIREKGGAYGGGASARSLDGVFNFYSYRDPNPLNTISIMKNSGQWAVNRSWTDSDLEEAKLSVFQKIDAPQSVSSEGLTRFLSGVSDEMMQEHRERLLDVNQEQIKEVAQKFIIDSFESHKEGLVFLGEKKSWVDDTWEICEMGIASQQD